MPKPPTEKLSCVMPAAASTLKTSFGAIEASNIPKGVRATTGNGAINLTDIGADTYAKTSFGSITAEHINGNLTAEDSNGSVTARNVKGDANVTTSFSGVTLESIGGRITVDNQNGAIYVTALHPSAGCRDISLKTSFSSIRVGIPEGVGYNLAAHTSFGRISSDLPVTASGNIGGDSLNGTIGSGGCQCSTHRFQWQHRNRESPLTPSVVAHALLPFPTVRYPCRTGSPQLARNAATCALHRESLA